MAHPLPCFDDNDGTLTPRERANWIAVLPLGAYEQHGPHLPFETDTLIAEGMSATQLRDVGRIAAVVNAAAQCIAAE